MAGLQIPSGITMLNSLKGFQGISLNEYNTSAAASIAAGSVVEIAGAFFTFVADENINAASWTAIVTGTTAYITLTPSGSAPTQIVDVAYTAAAPVWRDDFQGWYATAASNIRVIGSVYKAEAANYANKKILSNEQNDRPKSIEVYISSGTFLVPNGVNAVYLTGCAAGGAGGLGGDNLTFGGGGGGSGEIIYNKKNAVTPGSSITVTIGAVGSNTSFGATVLNYGANGATGAAGGAGGAGGVLNLGSLAGVAGATTTTTSPIASNIEFAGGGTGGVSSGGYSGGGGGAGGLGYYAGISLATNGATASVAGGVKGSFGGGGGGGGVGGGINGGRGGDGGYGSGGGGGGSNNGVGIGGAGGSGGPAILIVEW